MTSLPTLPRRTWLERTSLTLSVLLVLVGVVSLVAWWLRMDELLLPIPNTSPIRANTALAVAIFGLVLFAVEFEQRMFALAALVSVAIGLLTLAEQFTRHNLRIDELLAIDHLFLRTEQPGRMSNVSALTLVLGGLVLAWRCTSRAARARLAAEAFVGSLIAAVGFSTLLGYVVKLEAVYKWGGHMATGPVTGFAFLLFGAALLLLAWRESMKQHHEAPSWSPLPAVIGCLTLTVILSVGLREREVTAIRQRTQSQSDALATQIGIELDRQTNRFERLARGRDLQIATLGKWQEEVAPQFDESRQLGCVSIAYVDPAGRTVWYYPIEGSDTVSGFNHREDPVRARAMDEAGNPPSFPATISSSTTIVVTTPQIARKQGLVIYAPIVRDDRVTGYVAAEFVYDQFFNAIWSARRRADPDNHADYHVGIELNGETIYAHAASDPTRRDDLAFERSYTVADRRIRIALTPSNAAVSESRGYLPELSLAAGFGITLLLGLSVHLARSARAGQRAAELSNKKLFAENEERRRIEARLKVSDERLRLALDSTQIGIFEWSVAAGHVYYSPGLWAMLGYDHARMPSTVEAWQSLIHPDDLPLYRRRTDSQLNGIASFIEPEYRVRARSGDWRWVYTRSKSVATNPDGRPTRIIGTVQDITARREAELALRESQAEARKLSLVASKTDNPVLIGSPDGRIEWANEAFCRVMEYSLEEVVGKNPAHFMVGPDTNPRTVARIRAAMARGQGISTDVVNYAKSGRKYHLHLEVQPVRGANGELENFIAVQTDITARVETEHQLRRAKAEADDASRAKSDFLASMSHEIRTPMNGVIGMTSLLMETTLNAEQRDFVNTIRSSGEALLTIINDILDFSKIESGKMELERAPFELSLCLEEALDLFALQASAKKLDIGYHVAPDVPAWIMGDVTRLRQIIVNLVNNAVKFTPSGAISLEVRRALREPTPLGFDPGFITDPTRIILDFTVRDTGIGIPPERIDRLFKAFSQVDSSTTRKYGGTGLGLAICQRLVHLMGGDIRVESKVGHGSTFSFTIATEAASNATESGLPALPAPLRDGLVLCVEDHAVLQARLQTLFEKWGARCIVAPHAAEALQIVARLPQPPALLVVEGGELDGPSPSETLASLRCPRLILYPFGQTAPTPPSADVPCASTSKPIRTTALLHAIYTLFNPGAATPGTLAAKSDSRPIGHEIPLEVLLAEDNAVNQKVALRFLERLGYRAEAVANGLEAVTAVENRRYDLVLMDLQMPEMDGYEATRQIRARLPADRQPKIIALTANAMSADRELCVAAGMDDHISKPVKMHEISAAIRKHFGEAKTRELIG
ncbi:MAG TPA: response regulator [Opitutaceae bacterium]|nr:response regulator [Opitutaceae bacterium]